MVSALRRFWILLLTICLALCTFAVVAQMAYAAGTTLSEDVSINAHHEREFKWTIDKSVEPDTLNLFRGDSGTSEYTVSVTKDEGTLHAYIDGEVCVTNGGAEATQNLQIVGELRNGIPPPNDLVTTFPISVSDKPVLDPGETHCYPYSVDIPADRIHAGAPFKITANTTITNHAPGVTGGPSASASTTLPTETLVNNSISVDDDVHGSLGTFDHSGSTSYTQTFTCDEDEGTHNNTASISPASASDNPSASASVEVNCFALDVKKDANTSFTRKYNWTIDKTAYPTVKTIATGATFQAKYSVKVDVAGYTDSNQEVHGQITVSNPTGAPDATINSVSDVVSGAGDANVNCGSTTFPHTLAAGDTLTCSYSKDLPDSSSRTNTATATLQNHTYDSAGTATESGTTDFSGTAAVTFGNNPTTEVDKTITVRDPAAPNGGTLGTATFGVDPLPKTFTYYRTIGPYADECGDKKVDNTATLFGHEDTVLGTASATVTAHVLCNVKVVKTVSGKAPSGDQAFTFELRQGASTTQPGTTLETKVANAGNGGVINFTSGLEPGSTYQLCEQVMPGWNTNLSGDGLFVPGSMITPQLPNPDVNNMTVCTNFTVAAGSTPRTFNVDNSPPPGGRALTIGFWKNWASCSGGKQKPMLDLGLGIASKTNTSPTYLNPAGGLVVSAQNAGSGWSNYAPTWYLVLKGDPTSTISNIKPAADCTRAVNLLNKSTTDGKKKMASDPLFNMTAQLIAAQLNRFMGAGINGTTILNIDRAVMLNGKYKFDGLTYSPKLTTADANLANCLATQLDNYNNDRPVSACP